MAPVHRTGALVSASPTAPVSPIEGQAQGLGASGKPDRATAVEPVPVSPLRDGTPSADCEADAGKFPSIGQFRNVVRAERESAEYHSRPPAKRTYVGTIKLHGTNAGIRLTETGELLFMSRTRVITPEDDNHGFARHMAAHANTIRSALAPLYPAQDMAVFGEWCGAGVQSNVGISAEQKLFMVFALRVGDAWADPAAVPRLPEARVFNVRDYPMWEREIDFSEPEQIQNDLIELTEAVEAACPVALAFGHAGIGEGIVWTPKDGDLDSRYWFKVKGEKHSSSKVKVLAAVDVERFAARAELVASLVTENRLQQGLDLHVNEFARPLEMSAIGDYLRWVFNDIAKEEADTITASGFDQKELGKPISDIAKRFYIRAAQGIEARSGETEGLDPTDESAVAKPCAQGEPS